MRPSSALQLPRFSSLDELVEFFENNDLGDYLDSMPAVEFAVNIKRKRRLVALDEDVAVKLVEIAKTQHIPSETLVNDWLREKVMQAD